MLNQLNIIGRVTTDPTLRHVNTKNGEISVCNINLAVSVFSQGSEKTTYFRVALWGNLAERAIKILKIGSLTFITGAVRVSQYVDKNNDPRASLEVNASNFSVLFTRNSNLGDKNKKIELSGNSFNNFTNTSKNKTSPNTKDKIDLDKVESKGRKDVLGFSFRDELKGIINDNVDTTQVAANGVNKYHFDNTNKSIEKKQNKNNLDLGDDDYE